MKFTRHPHKTTTKKVSKTLFLSVLLFQLNYQTAIALTEPQTQMASPSKSTQDSGKEESPALNIEPRNYSAQGVGFVNPNNQKKNNWYTKLKNRWNISVSFTKFKFTSVSKKVQNWYQGSKNYISTHTLTTFTAGSFTAIAGWYMARKTSSWLTKKLSTPFRSLKSKVTGKFLSFFSKVKLDLKITFIQSAKSTFKTISSSIVSSSILTSLIPIWNNSYTRNTRAWREGLAANLSATLNNFKNASLLPWIREKTKGKGKTFAIAGGVATFTASVAIGLLSIGPETVGVILAPEKTVEAVYNISSVLVKKEVIYTATRIQNPSLLIQDAKFIKQQTPALDNFLANKVQEFKEKNTQEKLNLAGDWTAEGISLIVGSHGANKVSKVGKVEDLVIGIDKANDILKTESSVGDLSKINQSKNLPAPVYGGANNYIPPITKYDLTIAGQNSLESYEKVGWQKLAGYDGGRVYRNDKVYLPQKEQGYYTEWDVNARQQGKNRGVERFVTGKNGEVYYTNTHYGDNPGVQFQRLK